MATSKTGSFTLVERIEGTVATANEVFQGTLDLGAYVDVGDQQAIAIESVDYIWQAYETDNDIWDYNLPGHCASNNVFSAQLSDLNPGTAILPADDNSLISSMSLYVDDSANLATVGPDLYPDNFGKLDESRMVVNDQLYVVGDVLSAATANDRWTCTIRIRCRIVKLNTKDWMAIAIQSTASDN